VGVLGGYTTFSSFEYETFQLVRDGARWMGLIYVMGSVVLGYFGVWLGAVLAGARR
jgi:fluoride exporter